jgi:hypothetical protein
MKRTVNIKGKEVSARAGIYAMDRFELASGISMEEAFPGEGKEPYRHKTMSHTKLNALWMYSCLIDPDITFDDFWGLLGDPKSTLINDISEIIKKDQEKEKK